MVRKLISLFSVFVLLSLILSGCSKQSKEYTDVIPKDVQTLFSLNIKSLFDKTGVTGQDVDVMKQDFIAAISTGMSIHSMEQIQRILTNPEKSGIDFEVPIYLFFNDDMSYVCLVNKVSNATDLRATLDIMKEEKLFQQYEKGSNYEYVLINGNVVLAFDNNALIIVALNSPSLVAKAKVHIDQMMNQSRENSVAANNGFIKMKEEKGDIHFISSAASLTSLYGQHIKNNLGYQNMDFKDLYVYGAVRFEEGAIKSNFSYYTENEKNRKLLKEQAETLKKTKGTFNHYFPASTLAYVEMGLNGEKVFDLLESNKGYYNELTPLQEEVLQKFISSLDGDLAFGLTNISMYDMPKFDLYASIKSSDFLEDVFINQEQLFPRGYSIKKVNDNLYKMQSLAFNFDYGVKDGKFFATNSKDYQSILTATDPSINSAPFGNELKGKKGMGVLNIAQILELPLVKAVTRFSSKEYKIYIDMVSKISYVDFENPDDNRYEMNIVLKDNSTNSLAQIVEYAKLFLALF